MFTLATLQNKKTTLVTIAIMIACIALFFFFPTNSLLEVLTASIVFFFMIPVLYIRVLLKDDLAAWGFAKVLWHKATVLACVGPAAVFAAFALLLLQSDAFVTAYSNILPLSAQQHFGFFLLYAASMGIFLFCVEFFFRGFVMPFLEKHYAMHAVIIQALIAGVFFFFDSLSAWNVALMAPLALCAGFIAHKTRSIMPSFIFSFVFVMTIAVAVISLT